MRNAISIAAAALAVCSAGPHAQTAAGTPPAVPTQQEHAAPGTGTVRAGEGLRDLESMTFGCPKAGLNAAAREAAKAPSQGTYQFSYFRIISDSHHASYEVHFKSNYQGEADLKYCVAIYCQQGWDPATAKTSVTVLGKAPHAAAGTSHAGSCGTPPAPVKRRVK
jgi:hypothetical protein